MVQVYEVSLDSNVLKTSTTSHTLLLTGTVLVKAKHVSEGPDSDC